MRWPRVLAATAAFLAGLTAPSGPPPATALAIYGGLRPVGGLGGCLRDAGRRSTTAARCPGVAQGLSGAAALAVSPDGRNVYVASPQSSSVVVLTRSRAAGALRPVRSPSGTSCVAAGSGSGCAAADPALGGADALALSPDGRFLYVGAADSATVSGFARGAGGLLRPLPAVTRLRPRRGTHQVQVKTRYGCVQGSALPGQHEACPAREDALAGVSALAVSPDGRNIYAVSYGNQPGEDSVVAMVRDPRGGGLSPLRGAGSCLQSRVALSCPAPSVAGMEGARSLLISPDGRFVYVVSQLSGAVVAMARDPLSGRLSALTGPGGCVSRTTQPPPISDVACGVTVAQLDGAQALTLSPDGRELFVAAFDPGAVVALSRDPVSGRLGPLGGAPLCLQAVADATCPVAVPILHGASAIAFSPDGRVLFVASQGGDSVLELTRDPVSGQAGLAATTPRFFSAMSGPASLALSREGGSLYLASPFDDAVAAFLTGP